MQEETKTLATSQGMYMLSPKLSPLPSFQTSIADHPRLQTCMRRLTPCFAEEKPWACSAPQFVPRLFFRGFKCMKYDPGPSTALLLLNTVDPLSSHETLAKSYYHRQKANGSKGSARSQPAPLSCCAHTTSESHSLVVASSEGVTRGRHFLAIASSAPGSDNLDIVWQEAIKSLSVLPSSLHGEGNSRPLLSIILHCVAVSRWRRVIKGHHFFPISFLCECGK